MRVSATDDDGPPLKASVRWPMDDDELAAGPVPPLARRAPAASAAAPRGRKYLSIEAIMDEDSATDYSDDGLDGEGDDGDAAMGDDGDAVVGGGGGGLLSVEDLMYLARSGVDMGSAALARAVSAGVGAGSLAPDAALGSAAEVAAAERVAGRAPRPPPLPCVVDNAGEPEEARGGGGGGGGGGAHRGGGGARGEEEEAADMYDGAADDRDAAWVAARFMPSGTTEAVLSCPFCFTAVCYESAGRRGVDGAYAALTVVGCRVAAAPDDGGGGELVVSCGACGARLGTRDAALVYHLDSVLPSSY